MSARATAGAEGNKGFTGTSAPARARVARSKELTRATGRHCLGKPFLRNRACANALDKCRESRVRQGFQRIDDKYTLNSNTEMYPNAKADL
jgi:hypothetical protein